MSNLTEHQAKVLQALKDAGLSGLNSYSKFRKDNAIQISGTIKELREKGYSIRSLRNQGDRSATYVLMHPTPLPTPESQKRTENAPEETTRPSGPILRAVAEPQKERWSVGQIERKLQELRDEYRKATLTQREIILRRAKALQNALDLLKSKPIQAP